MSIYPCEYDEDPPSETWVCDHCGERITACGKDSHEAAERVEDLYYDHLDGNCKGGKDQGLIAPAPVPEEKVAELRDNIRMLEELGKRR